VPEVKELEEWSIYAGVPVELIKKVNKEEVRKLEFQFRRSLDDFTE
jgi:carbonic anhydrase/acetyltransferase-like protein (isoleucine patch superfamily)